jgi:hypothetical protein
MIDLTIYLKCSKILHKVSTFQALEVEDYNVNMYDGIVM